MPPNRPGDPFGQRQRALAEEEKRLADEAARLRRELEEKAARTEAEARAARRREENPGIDAEEDRPAPVHRHSAARRRDRARFFVLFGFLVLVILWLIRVLS